ncbi:unnamed protein product [Arctia plantaginis]|uniref:Secreted protein n=1 Tax=Arctia plantaginis TaxID=874455 RepID=A0A8S0ZNM6_ARCPL|nr:unnamed protein product [Arctia plantaginis]
MKTVLLLLFSIIDHVQPLGTTLILLADLVVDIIWKKTSIECAPACRSAVVVVVREDNIWSETHRGAGLTMF